MRHGLVVMLFSAACGGGKAAPPPSNAASAGGDQHARTCVKAEIGCMQLGCIDAVAAELLKDQRVADCKTGDGTPFAPSDRERAVHTCYERETCAEAAQDCEWTRTPALEACLAAAPKDPL